MFNQFFIPPSSDDIGTVATGYRLLRVNEDQSSDHGDKPRVPYARKVGFNSRRTLPTSMSPLRLAKKACIKVFDQSKKKRKGSKV